MTKNNKKENKLYNVLKEKTNQELGQVIETMEKEKGFRSLPKDLELCDEIVRLCNVIIEDRNKKVVVFQ